jgi:hypothetical protein
MRCSLTLLAMAVASATPSGKIVFESSAGTCVLSKADAAAGELNTACDLSVTQDGVTTSLLSLKADIAAAVATLQGNIDTISLTKGDKGDKGDKGEQGDEGEAGAPGTNANTKAGCSGSQTFGGGQSGFSHSGALAHGQTTTGSCNNRAGFAILQCLDGSKNSVFSTCHKDN